jgi:hypothetical protein
MFQGFQVYFSIFLWLHRSGGSARLSFSHDHKFWQNRRQRFSLSFRKWKLNTWYQHKFHDFSIIFPDHSNFMTFPSFFKFSRQWQPWNSRTWFKIGSFNFLRLQVTIFRK